MAAKQRDLNAILIADLDIVDAAAAMARDFCGDGCQPVAWFGWLNERDRTVLGYSDLIVGIAGKSKGAIGKRENIAAMTVAVAIGHVGPDCETDRGAARPNLLKRHSKGS